MAIRTQAAPKPPVDPTKYRPSRQVRRMVEIIVESGQMGQPHSAWLMPEERRFNDGHRHGLNVALRALVELETRIEDSNVLDQLIGDMMEEATAQ